MIKDKLFSKCWPTILHVFTILYHVLLHRAPREEFVRETRQRDDWSDGEEESGKIRNIRLVELCPDREGTHLLLVNSSPGKEGRRVCWERGLEKREGSVLLFSCNI